VQIRDKRPLREQIKSGFRLAGWVLLTLVFIFLVLVSTAMVVGKGNYSHSIYRFVGLCGLLAVSTIMLITARRWAKWFVALLGYMILKLAVSALLGRTPSVPSIMRPRLVFLEFLAVLAFAAILCARYLTHAPRKLETVALVGLVVALSFSTISDSSLPTLAAALVLGLVQLAHARWAKRLISRKSA